jgi:hypothetical protein
MLNECLLLFIYLKDQPNTVTAVPLLYHYILYIIHIIIYYTLL